MTGQCVQRWVRVMRICLYKLLVLLSFCQKVVFGIVVFVNSKGFK
jgi:hypothetical protein